MLRQAAEAKLALMRQAEAAAKEAAAIAAGW